MADSNRNNHKVGQWTYKSMKQMTKIKISYAQYDDAQKIYQRLLECMANPCFEGVFPNAIEKGMNGMLDRVSALFHSSTSGVTNAANESASSEGANQKNNPQDLAKLVYASTIKMSQPQYGTSSYRTERLWFKTRLKYGQLLHENHNTYDLQNVISDLIQNAVRITMMPMQRHPTSTLRATTTSSSSSSTLSTENPTLLQSQGQCSPTQYIPKSHEGPGWNTTPTNPRSDPGNRGMMHMASAEYEW